MAPGIAPANERYGRLAELREPMARATNRIDNRDLVGIGTPLKMTTGAVTGGAGGAATGWIAAILDAPTPKARLARAIDALRKNPVLSADAQYAAFVRQLAAEAGVTNSLLFGEDQTPSQNTLMLMGY